MKITTHLIYEHRQIAHYYHDIEKPEDAYNDVTIDATQAIDDLIDKALTIILSPKA